MAKREQMYRLMYIINLLKSKPYGASYEEIREYLEEKYYKEDFENEIDFAFSEKTFKRDRKLLSDLFKIEVGFKRSTMTYQIIDSDMLDSSQTVFDNLLLVKAYQQTEKRSEIMMFEKRQASGLHNLEGLIFAIKNSKIISFNYTKHWEGVPHRRVIEPYALKEFSNRWYLLGKEFENEKFFIKSFGLDRISDLEIHNKSFLKINYDVNEMFVNSFGIISTTGDVPEKIIISFDPEQGRYIKTLPFHRSQKVLIDNNDEYRIELNLVPTFDFYQELLKHTGRVKILEPKSVKEEYINCLKKGLNLNVD